MTSAPPAPDVERGAVPRAVAVSAPGKLILTGEHAVVYGRPALVAAIDLRLRAVLSSPVALATDIEIDLPGLAHRTACSWHDLLEYARRVRAGWEAYAARPVPAGFQALRGDDPAHVVKVALGEAALDALELGSGTPPPLALRVESEIPVGAGFGSSAAAAVAVVAGYALWQDGQAGGADGRLPPLERIERVALEVERRQHGLPSGVDTATSLRGGLLWARRPPGGGELSCVSLAATSPLLGRLRVVHTGMPAEPTGAVVAAVRAHRDRDPAAYERLFDRMEAAATGLRDELAPPASRPEPPAARPERAGRPERREQPARPERVRALIAESEACLEALGVVPEPVRALVRQVEAAGGAAKVSGAGSLAGPGAGSLLVYHAEVERIGEWGFLRPFPIQPVHLGAAGIRREAP